MDERAETLDQLQRDTGVEFRQLSRNGCASNGLTDIGTPMLTVPVRFRVSAPVPRGPVECFRTRSNSAALRSNSSSPECVRVDAVTMAMEQRCLELTFQKADLPTESRL